MDVAPNPEPKPLPNAISASVKPQPPPVVGAPTPDLATTDIPCLNCGYNLRGLTAKSMCPECGTPVQRSIQGNLLIHSSPEYLRTLSRGLTLILIAVLCEVAFIVLKIAGVIVMEMASPMSSQRFETAADLLSLPIAGMSLYGWWLFSAPDPAIVGRQTGDGPRRAIRGAVIAAALATVGTLSAGIAIREPQAAQSLAMFAGLIDSIAWLVKFFASMMYIHWLAPRFPSRQLETQANQYMWLIPVVYIVGACVVVGPVIAIIMYCLMLNNSRLIVKSIMARQSVEYPEMAA